MIKHLTNKPQIWINTYDKTISISTDTTISYPIGHADMERIIRIIRKKQSSYMFDSIFILQPDDDEDFIDTISSLLEVR